jgi:ubiquinone/menaquinone biosynthesis C-methylase UbiE
VDRCFPTAAAPSIIGPAAAQGGGQMLSMPRIRQIAYGQDRSAHFKESPMAAADNVFAGSIPEIYDRYLVPLIFDAYALDLAERVAVSDPRDVLETAAGTGVLTRAIAARHPTYSRMVVTDLNQPMLDHATARQLHDGRIEWKHADALALPFTDQSFDVVVCQFGVMFFPDKIRGYEEAYRVLRSGGRLLFNVWDRISENEFADVVTEALAALFPRDPPRFMARVPHGYHDLQCIRAELNAAGFVDISVDVVEERSRARSPFDPAIAFCQGTPLRNEIEARYASRLEDVTKRVSEVLAHRFGSGAIEGRTRAFVITAVR